MVGYAIGAAWRSGLFDHVLVSTDDDEIAEIAREYGAELPFRRPPELADDLTPTVPVIAHAIRACQALGWDVAETCCIYPSVPFVRADDIRSALELLQVRGGVGYTFPVTGFPSPIQRALRRTPDGTVAPFHPEYVNTRTQDLEPAFHDAGQFYWAQARTWLDGLSIHGHGAAIVLPEWRVVDIDTADDWARAEALFETMARRDVP